MIQSPHHPPHRRVRRHLAVYVLATIAVLVSLAGPATAGAATLTEFSAGITPSAGLRDITRDDRGDVWFTETDASKVGRITSSGRVSEYDVWSPPTSIVAGPSGNVWTTGPDLRYGLMGLTPSGSPISLWDTAACEQAMQLTPGTGATEVRTGSRCGDDGTIESFLWSPSEQKLFSAGTIPLTSTAGCYANNGPFVATGQGGDYWLSCYDESVLAVARVAPGDPASVSWVWQGYVGIPGPIVVAPDGSAWFTQSSDARFPQSAHSDGIGRIDPDGRLTNFRTGLTGMGLHESGVHGIAVGPDGNIWFTEPATDRIGRISPAGVITEFPLAAGAAPQGITVGNGRTLWFTEPGLNRIGRLDLNEGPSASIAVSGSPMTSTPLTFDGSSSRDPDGSIVEYRWDLGDGSSASGPRATHAFERPGTYSVTLTATDNEGATAQTRRDVVIADPVLRVGSASASVKWNLRYAAGRVIITGSSEKAARVAFALTRAKARFELGEASIPAGPFTVRLTAPRTLLPGVYVLVGRQVSGKGPALRIDSEHVRIASPPQGIVDTAVAIDARGKVVRAVRPLGSRRLSGRFHFVVTPQAGARLEARWIVPHRAKPIVDPAPKRRRGSRVVTSIFARSPLPQGLYVCQLRAAGKQVASLKMRIG